MGTGGGKSSVTSAMADVAQREGGNKTVQKRRPEFQPVNNYSGCVVFFSWLKCC